jgi:hypothetical protein
MARRASQAAKIKSWSPWDRSTGPLTADGKRRSCRNAWRGDQRGQLRELMKSLRQTMRQQNQMRVDLGRN